MSQHNGANTHGHHNPITTEAWPAIERTGKVSDDDLSVGISKSRDTPPPPPRPASHHLSGNPTSTYLAPLFARGRLEGPKVHHPQASQYPQGRPQAQKEHEPGVHLPHPSIITFHYRDRSRIVEDTVKILLQGERPLPPYQVPLQRSS